MHERQPPAISEETPIGPDVDLNREEVQMADGTRLTEIGVAGIIEAVRGAAGESADEHEGMSSPPEVGAENWHDQSDDAEARRRA